MKNLNLSNLESKPKDKNPALAHSAKKNWLTILSLLITLVLLIGVATYAWFSAGVSYINGIINVGDVKIGVKVYDEAGSLLIDDSTSETNKNIQNIVSEDDFSWSSGSVGYRFFEINNLSEIDIKSFLSCNFETSIDETTLNYFYFRIADVSEAYTNYESQTGKSFKDYIASGNYTPNDAVYISQNGMTLASLANNQKMGSISTSASKYYCFEYCCYDIPTSLLSNVSENPSIKINAKIIGKQVNAPDDENADNGSVYHISDYTTLTRVLATASSGDTIYLTSNIESPYNTNLTLIHKVNLYLNGYSLTIHGNLAYDYAAQGECVLDVTGSSSLRVDGDIIIDAPLSSFEIAGSGAQSILLGVWDENIGKCIGGDIYVNTIRDTKENSDKGFTLNNISVGKSGMVASILSDIYVLSDTQVNIGAGSEIGGIYSEDEACLISIYNYGSINRIDLTKMTRKYYDGTIEIFIKNHGVFTGNNPVLYLPYWSLSRRLSPEYYNTRVINSSGSMVGWELYCSSNTFTNEDIENEGDLLDSVINLGSGCYQVNKKNNADTIEYLLTKYFENNGGSASNIKGLIINTYNDATVSDADFVYMKSDAVQQLSSLDLSGAVIENGKIPDSAMIGKTSLTDLVMPKAQTQIGDYAFQNTSIQYLSLGTNVTEIGTKAFDIYSASSTTKIYVTWLSATIPNDEIMKGFTSSKTIMFMYSYQIGIMRDKYTLGNEWFFNFYEYYDYIIGDYFCTQNGSATDLKIIYYKNTTKYNPTNLVPETLLYGSTIYYVNEIGQSAFVKAINATPTTKITLDLPDNCETVGDYAFYRTSSLGVTITSLNLNKVTTVGNYAFYHSSVSNLCLGLVDSLGDYAFSYSSISSTSSRPAEFENAMIYLGTGAFKYATVSNSEIDLSGNYSISNEAFAKSKFISSTLAFRYVDTLNSGMMSGMTCSDTSLDARFVNTIASGAFSNVFVTSYTSTSEYTNTVDISNVYNIGESAFLGLKVGKLIMGMNADGGYLNQSLVNNGTYSYIFGTGNGVKIDTLNINGYLPYSLYFTGKNYSIEITKLIFSDAVEEVNPNLFKFNAESAPVKIGEVVFGNKINMISNSAFYGVSFTSETPIDFSNITSIDTSAFQKASFKWTGTLAFPENLSIGSNAFRDTKFLSLEILDIKPNTQFGTSSFNAAKFSVLKNLNLPSSTNERLENGCSLSSSVFYNADFGNVTVLDFSGFSKITNNALVRITANNLQTLNLSNVRIIQSGAVKFSTVFVLPQLIIGMDENITDSSDTEFYYGGTLKTYATDVGIFGELSSNLSYSNNELTINNFVIDGVLPGTKTNYSFSTYNSVLTFDSLFIKNTCSVIPANVFRAVNGKTSINNITVESGADLSLESYCFGGVTFGGPMDFSGVKYVKANVFTKSTIEEMYFDEALYSFTASSIQNCSNLVKIHLNKTDEAPKLSGTVTPTNASLKIYVPSIKLQEYLTAWSALENYIVLGDYSSGNWSWMYSNNTNTEAIVTGYTGTETSVQLPSYFVDGSKKVIVTEISKDIFADKDVTTVTLPATLKYFEEGSLSNPSIANISFVETETIDSNVYNCIFKAQNLVIYNADMTQLIRYLPQKGGTSFNVPNTVTFIGKGAFEGASITDFYLPQNTPPEIGDYDVFGNPRVLINNDRHIQYDKDAAMLHVSSASGVLEKYDNSPYYQLYNSVSAIVADTAGANNIARTENKKQNVVVGKVDIDGLEYVIVKTGAVYNNVLVESEYDSKYSAVLVNVSKANENGDVVITDTIEYNEELVPVVAIDDNAFANFKDAKKLVLPNHNVYYTSRLFKNALNLGFIQYDDVIPYNCESDEIEAVIPKKPKEILDDVELDSDDEE